MYVCIIIKHQNYFFGVFFIIIVSLYISIDFIYSLFDFKVCPDKNRWRKLVKGLTVSVYLILCSFQVFNHLHLLNICHVLL
jgi:hypothetical protein